MRQFLMGMSETDAKSFQRVCSTEDVVEDSPYVAEVDGLQIAVFYADGEYFALNNVCPHQGGPLGQGKVEEKCVYCPWHGWQFDLDSGEHMHGKGTVERYDITIDDNDIYVLL
jgi:nitrite reductase (NADH) small subunit